MSYQSYMQQALSDIYKKKQPQGFGQPSRLIGKSYMHGGGGYAGATNSYLPENSAQQPTQGYGGSRPPPWAMPEGTPFNWQGGLGANAVSGTGVAPVWGSFPPPNPPAFQTNVNPPTGGYQPSQTSPISEALGNRPFLDLKTEGGITYQYNPFSKKYEPIQIPISAEQWGLISQYFNKGVR